VVQRDPLKQLRGQVEYAQIQSMCPDLSAKSEANYKMLHQKLKTAGNGKSTTHLMGLGFIHAHLCESLLDVCFPVIDVQA